MDVSIVAKSLGARIDRIFGVEFASDLAEFFERITASLSAIIIDAHFEQVQQVTKRFLFDAGFQEIGVRVSERATKVVVRHDKKDTKPPFPEIYKVGDVDLFAQFFASSIEMNKRKMAVNELRCFMGVAGMLPLAVIVRRGRMAMKMAVEGVPARVSPAVQGRALLKSMGMCFPHFSSLVGNLVVLDTVDLAMTERAGAGMFLEMSAEVDVAKIRELYPSMESLLNHLADYYIVMVDDDAAAGPPESARTMMVIRLHHDRGTLKMEVTTMLAGGEGGGLLWFDRKTQQPCVDAAGVALPIAFEEDAPGYRTAFRIVIEGTFRIPQLGCGSIGMPQIVTRMEYQAGKALLPHPYGPEGAPAAHITLSVAHVGERKMTSFLLRPFFNLDLLRFVLMQHFRMRFTVGAGELPVVQMSMEDPAAHAAETEADNDGDDDNEFFDAIAGDDDANAAVAVHEEIVLSHAKPAADWSRRELSWDARKVAPWRFVTRVHLFIPQPPRVITSCMSVFIGEQMAKPDNVQLAIDMLSAVAVDLRGVVARLSKGDGNVALAALAESEAVHAEERARETRVRVVSLTGPPPPQPPRRSAFHRLLYCGR